MAFCNKLESWVQVLDLFGQDFKLKINEKDKMKTCVGALLTLFIIFMIVLSLCCLSDELISENSKIISKDGYFSLSEFPVYSGKDYDLKTIIIGFPEELDIVQKLKISSFRNELLVNVTYLKKCTKSFLLSQNLTTPDDLVFYCFNLNDYQLGRRNSFIGEDKEKYFYNIDISSEKFRNLTQLDITNKKNKNPQLFIWSPRVALNLQNDSLFQNVYLLDKFELFKEKQIILDYETKAYLKEVKKGSFHNAENYLDIGFHKFSFRYVYVDFSSTDRQDYPIIQMQIYLSDKYKNFITLKKGFYSIISEFGGFLSIFFFLFNLINNFFRFYYIDTAILNNFFDLYEPICNHAIIKENSKFKLFSNTSDKKLTNNFPIKVNASEFKLNNQSSNNFEDINLKLIKEKKINLTQSRLTIDPFYENFDCSSGRNKQKKKSTMPLTIIDQNKVNESNIHNIQNLIALNKLRKRKQEKEKEIENNKRKYMINFCKYNQKLCKLCRKNDSSYLKFFIASQLIKKFTSYDFILKKILEMEIFKSFILERNQQLSLSGFKKIGMNEIFQYKKGNEESSKYFSDLLLAKRGTKNIWKFFNSSFLITDTERENFTTNYFVNLIRSNENLSNFDEYIFDNLGSDLKENIQIKTLDENCKHTLY